MRNVVIGAAIVGLAAVTANCSGSQGLNSANDLVAPSVLQVVGDASTPNLSPRTKGGGNNGNGNGNGGGIPTPDPIGSLTVVIANDVGATGVSVGDTVSFEPTEGSAPAGSYMSLNCYQGSNWIYAMGGYPSGYVFMLSSVAWESGEADCTAKLYTTTGTLAKVTFHVAG
jgi:hypothetical protein